LHLLQESLAWEQRLYSIGTAYRLQVTQDDAHTMHLLHTTANIHSSLQQNSQLQLLACKWFALCTVLATGLMAVTDVSFFGPNMM